MKQMLKLLVALVLFSPIVFAQEKPYPYSGEGWVDSINIENGYIVVDDGLYPIVPYVEVHIKNDTLVGLENISAKMPIGFLLEGNKIIEIWVLDRNPKYIDPNDE